MKLYSAYTLIELIITTSILIIIVGISIPQLIIDENLLLERELGRIYTTAFYLRQRAISTNSQQELFLNPEKQLFYYYENNKKYLFNLHKLTQFGFLKGSKGPPSNPAMLIKSAITFDSSTGSRKISFYPDGTSNAGTIYLINAKQTKMGALTCGVSQVFYGRRYLYKKSIWHPIGHHDDEKKIASISYNPAL